MARRRNRGQMVPYGRGPVYQAVITGNRRRGVRNWVVGGSGADGTGTPVADQSSWGGSASAAIGESVSFSLVHVYPAVQSGTPSTGTVRIDAVQGRVFMHVNTGVFSKFAIGIYVAELNSTTTKWSVRNPASQTDAQRDDYLFLQGGLIWTTPSNGPPAFQTDPCYFDIDIRSPVAIGAGEGLFLTMGVHADGVNPCNCVPFVRTLIGPVA